MMKIIKEKIANFFLTNQFLRKVRNFFHQVFFPLLLKWSLIILTLVIFILLVLKIFKPNYIDKIYQKSSFYFFHLLNLDSQEIGKINISGNKYVTKDEIIAIVDELKNAPEIIKSADYQPLIRSLVEQIKEQLPWVNQVTITRTMPGVLNISLVEYEPFAIWQNDGKKYLTDKEGNLIPYQDLEEFRQMVILSGKGANKHAKSLFNIFASDPNLSANVYSATWVSSRRWDIRFENGLIIKLPESNISEAWQRLIKIYNLPGSIVGLKIIDLRLADKVYLEYDDSVIKELKSL